MPSSFTKLALSQKPAQHGTQEWLGGQDDMRQAKAASTHDIRAQTLKPTEHSTKKVTVQTTRLKAGTKQPLLMP